MEAATAALAPNLWDVLPTEAQRLIRDLHAQVLALEIENATLHTHIRELEARVGQDSSNSARPPSSDSPHAVRKRLASPTGRRRGGQPGHPGHFRSLLPTEQVDDVVVVIPERCRHCQAPLPRSKARRKSRPWRHQVVELLPLAVRVTEYQMQVRRCPACGRRTRATLPAGIPRRPFGPRLTAVVALLSGRYRLSWREVQQALVDVWVVRLSLGAVVHLEQAQSATLGPVVQAVREAVHQAAVANLDETGWREQKRRAWLWTAVTSQQTVFHIDRSRGGAAIEALLGPQFTGGVGSDRWSAYSRFPPA
jgi:transposase